VKKPVHDPRLAVAYLRVSTPEQRVDVQIDAIRRYAERERLSVVGAIDDHLDRGVSGANDLEDRPALMRALGTLRASRAGVLLVHTRDRLARDVYVAAYLDVELERFGARVLCADDQANGSSPADAFLRTVLDGAAAYEREMTRAATKGALAVKRSHGERIGTVPLGFGTVGDKLVPDAVEGAAVARARELRAGGASLRAIVRTLDHEHPARGKRWHLTTVARVLRREC
jgi:DNA invertase Pin-like site-specific DNA recombinase